jgi:hypothetical protein
MGLFSRRSSTTNTSSTQNFYDQRSVNDAGGGIIGDGNSVDGSTNYLDASITTINATDPGAVRLGELNAEFLGAAAESQTDAVRALAQWGKEGFAQMGESVTDLYALAGSNTARAWSHTLDSSDKLFALAGSNTAKAWSQTLDSSEKLLGRMLDSAGRTTDAAKVVAQSAIASYQPAEKSQADALRMGLLIGGGVLLAVLIFRKA